jgi:hypothetical protein
MSSTTALQKFYPIVVDSNLGVALINLNRRVASAKATFNTVLLDAVDAAFFTFGEFNSQAIYSHLKSKFGIAREAIPCDVEGFAAALEDVFGEGALLIEIQIMKSLHNKLPQLRFSSKRGELSFTSFLEYVRSYMSKM